MLPEQVLVNESMPQEKPVEACRTATLEQETFRPTKECFRMTTVHTDPQVLEEVAQNSFTVNSTLHSFLWLFCNESDHFL